MNVRIVEFPETKVAAVEHRGAPHREHEVAPNAQGVIPKVIPGGRCAATRHLGSRENMSAAVYLYDVWFPRSGESLRDFPIFFHYVNVGPNVREHEMVTDVYLPLR